MGRLAERAFSEEGLRRAWSEVSTARDPDEPRPSLRRFEEHLDDEIGRLVADLAWGAYEPRDLIEVIIQESDRQRALQVPPVRDRVVERAVLEVLTPVVDPELGPASYAYRPGLGVLDAVQAVVALREEGLGWVARADVDECFPTTPVPLARRLLGALVDDEELLAVVDVLLRRQCQDRRGRRRAVRGLAQGSAISPLLANLVLAGVDGRVLEVGFPLVRYADDMAVGAASREEAWEAVRAVSHAVEEVGMALGADNTAVMSFEEGFSFLGEDFGPRYPPSTPEARVVEPERKVLYAGLQGGRIRTAEGRVVVESKDDAEVLDLPSTQVGRIVCFGAVGVSAGVRSWAMSSGVDVVFASRRGGYLGSMVSGESAARADRIRRQVQIEGTPQGLAIAARVIEAKVRKQVVVLQRFGRRSNAGETAEAITQMRHALAMVPEATTREELMGLEGAAAAAYFPAFGALLPADLAFVTRSRRPPMDVANAALSFLYTILLGECTTALVSAGLEPAIGVLHSDHESRPSLALDLMEEFRPLIVDQVVMTCARQGALKASHGRVEQGRAGVLLTQAGREAVLDAYERRMLTQTRGALPDFAGTLRRHLYRQAQRLQGAIVDPGREWTGLTWR